MRGVRRLEIDKLIINDQGIDVAVSMTGHILQRAAASGILFDTRSPSLRHYQVGTSRIM